MKRTASGEVVVRHESPQSRGSTDTAADKRFQRKEAPALDEVYIARSGLRSFTDRSGRDLGKNIFINPELHISSKEPSIALKVCEKSSCIKEWYDNLNSAEKDLVIRAGFEPLINSIRPHNKPDTGLIQALAEKWWDTTHTFHFPAIGEMTMTPTDFSAITGIRVSGEPIILRKIHGVDRDLLRSMLGPKSDGIYGDTITGRWLWETYGSNGSDRPVECDVNVRAFALALLAYVLLSNEQNTVPIAYIYCLEDVENIATFNWGATSLAYQYIQMDDLCRGSRTWLGGIWQSWEVWVKEYIPWISFTPSPDAVNVFPRIRRWEAQPNAEGDLNILLATYRLKFNMVQEKQVVWDVFTDKQNLPQYVTQTKRTTDQRVLLMGLQGGTWYLGERVRRQIAGVHRAVVPKPPPPSMTKTSCLRIQLKINGAVFGRPYRFFVDRACGHSYEIYRNRLAQALSTALTKTKCGFDDEAFKLPAWTVIVPTYEDESDIISIPMGKRITNYEIPPSVTAVSRTNAVQLLDMLAGMHHLLIQYIREYKEKSRVSTAEIEHLRYQLASLKDDGHSESSY